MNTPDEYLISVLYSEYPLLSLSDHAQWLRPWFTCLVFTIRLYLFLVSLGDLNLYFSLYLLWKRIYFSSLSSPPLSFGRRFKISWIPRLKSFFSSFLSNSIFSSRLKSFELAPSIILSIFFQILILNSLSHFSPQFILWSSLPSFSPEPRLDIVNCKS